MLTVAIYQCLSDKGKASEELVLYREILYDYVRQDQLVADESKWLFESCAGFLYKHHFL